MPFAKAGSASASCERRNARWAIRFASRRDDKFEGFNTVPGSIGVPVVPDSLAVLDCEVESVVEGGDHFIFIGKVKHVESQAGGQPLVYFRGAYATVDS